MPTRFAHEFIRARRVHPLFAALALGGCLSPGGGENTTSVVLTAGSDETAGSISISISVGDSTQDGVMTTTESPETGAGSSEGSSGSSSSGEPPPPDCGDGEVQADEQCDEGDANADDGACTTQCQKATCGDGLLQAGVELCDDGVNNGEYGSCKADCTDLAAHCGDQILDVVEGCDDDDPASGCLPDCTVAQSCLQIREAYPDELLADGVYKIQRAGKDPFKVLCDMDADGGGYTFLKYAVKEGDALKNALAAEAACDEWDMDLWIPRSYQHVLASLWAAQSLLLVPVGTGSDKNELRYMSLIGVYPAVVGLSCPGQALTTNDCPEWKAKTGKYWITNMPIANDVPGKKNCKDCSMYYTWDPVMKTVIDYEVVLNGGVGASTSHFMCAVPDKAAPP